MTIIEKMARAIEGQLKPFVILGDSVALEIARAARDALVLGLTDEHLNRCDEAGHCAAIKDLDRDAMYFDAFRAALLQLTEVGE